MPTGSTKARNSKLIGTKRAAEVLLPFAARESESHLAGTRAEWYMTATQPISGKSVVPALELVAWQAGHELGRWPLHAMAYGSLVSGLAQQPEGPFAIPHAKGFCYDEYDQVSSRVAAAEQVFAELVPPYNALLYRMCRTERTAGLSVSEVENWLKQAEHILHVTKGLALRQFLDEVGPPRYATHSSYLSDLLPAVQQGTQLLKEFLTASLPPASPPNGRERATAGKTESRWDWVQLNNRKRWLPYYSDFTTKMFEYLPEVEIGEYGEGLSDFEDKEPEIRLGANQFPAHIQPSSTSAVRSQLLEIRQRVDDLLASLE